MLPPRNFPEGFIELVEMDGKEITERHAKLPTNTRNRMKIQNMRNDLLMVNPRLNLQILENGGHS
jgi:hypothetical protein